MNFFKTFFVYYCSECVFLLKEKNYAKIDINSKTS